MYTTARSTQGMIVTPHRLASQAGVAILRAGGNAVEAVVAAAAVLGVVYPHMTGIGGDGFWLLAPRMSDGIYADPIVIDACGYSGEKVTETWVEEIAVRGQLPHRGPSAVLTVAGAVAGWELALIESARWHGKQKKMLSRSVLLEDAIRYAEHGFPVSGSQSSMTAAALPQLSTQPGFASQFLHNKKVPAEGTLMRFPALANTLRMLAVEGFSSFYRGAIARAICADLARAGTPLTFDDIAGYQACCREPLLLKTKQATFYNTPPPTQGIASLLILGLLDRCMKDKFCDFADDAAMIHTIVEATKQAFRVRDTRVADPFFMDGPVDPLLSPKSLNALYADMKRDIAAPWPHGIPGGDTVWLGAIDGNGHTVSYIQSIYHEFGSGVVLPETGIVWQNRGVGFSMDKAHPNAVGPRKKPFHTLNPALAMFSDGRIMGYGTMGGDGQPQTQAAIMARHIYQHKSLQDAVALPRWLLGRAWGDVSTSLKLEDSFSSEIVAGLQAKGHDITLVPAHSSMMGHAGAVVRHAHGMCEGAYDMRSDGSVGCW